LAKNIYVGKIAKHVDNPIINDMFFLKVIFIVVLTIRQDAFLLPALALTDCTPYFMGNSNSDLECAL
jgi:hypothetical protein